MTERVSIRHPKVVRGLLLLGAVAAVALPALAVAIATQSSHHGWASRIWYHDDYRASEEVIRRIEDHRRRLGTLPQSLSEAGVPPSESCPCYEPTSTSNYKVWFGTVLGESISYESDTRLWH
jgi:hypothetical protein